MEMLGFNGFFASLMLKYVSVYIICYWSDQNEKMDDNFHSV
jgi:hypothetical protein